MPRPELGGGLPRGGTERPREGAVVVEPGGQGHPGAIPVMPVVGGVVRGAEGLRGAHVKRDGLYRVQTPQAFRFDAILAGHRAWDGAADAGDDAAVAEAAGLAIALVPGDERLRKVTFAEDLKDHGMTIPAVRTGMGYDVHRRAEGEELWLRGGKIDHPKGLAGHCDDDVGSHAAVEALVGAAAAGAIGAPLPPPASLRGGVGWVRVGA